MTRLGNVSEKTAGVYGVLIYQCSVNVPDVLPFGAPSARAGLRASRRRRMRLLVPLFAIVAITLLPPPTPPLHIGGAPGLLTWPASFPGLPLYSDGTSCPRSLLPIHPHRPLPVRTARATRPRCPPARPSGSFLGAPARIFKHLAPPPVLPARTRLRCLPVLACAARLRPPSRLRPRRPARFYGPPHTISGTKPLLTIPARPLPQRRSLARFFRWTLSGTTGPPCTSTLPYLILYTPSVLAACCPPPAARLRHPPAPPACATRPAACAARPS
ncbi:hypothetical protein B0H11DRAFT_2254139 [Mycena galericulata]|nr:hypothetical protein B0H11DRAFT_2254139 [Mycena galericulata]